MLKGSIQRIAQLIQSPKLEIKILSKAVIARLIPLDTASDEHAVLTMLTDEDAIGAIEILKMITSLNATMNFPCIHMLMDLGRSPHNMQVFINCEITAVLANVIDSVCEEEKSLAAEFIRRLMQMEYDGKEEISAISNNGSLQHDKEGMH